MLSVEDVSYIVKDVIKQYWSFTDNTGREFLYSDGYNIAYEVLSRPDVRTEEDFRQAYEDYICQSIGKEIVDK